MPFQPAGVTIQLRVTEIAAGVRFYQTLLGRPADLNADPKFFEWEVIPGCWLQIAEGTPTVGSGPLRFGVSDVASERQRLQTALGITIDPVETIPGLVSWSNFIDPWGNRIGLFQDLAMQAEA